MELQTVAGLGAGAVALAAAAWAINRRRAVSPLKVESVTYDPAAHRLAVVVANGSPKPYCIERSWLRQPAAQPALANGIMMAASAGGRALANLIAESQDQVVVPPGESASLTYSVVAPREIASLASDTPVEFSFEGSELEVSQFRLEGSAPLTVAEGSLPAAPEAEEALQEDLFDYDTTEELQKMLGLHILVNGDDILNSYHYTPPHLAGAARPMLRPTMRALKAGASLGGLGHGAPEDAPDRLAEISFSAALQVETPYGQYLVQKVMGEVVGEQKLGSTAFVEVRYAKAWGSKAEGMRIVGEGWVDATGTLSIKSDMVVSIVRANGLTAQSHAGKSYGVALGASTSGGVRGT